MQATDIQIYRFQSTQQQITIMFTATCFLSRMSQCQVTVRTIHVYKVTVLMLGSLKAYNFVTKMLSTVLQLKVATFLIVRLF
jgi:hypothetical protein